MLTKGGGTFLPLKITSNRNSCTVQIESTQHPMGITVLYCMSELKCYSNPSKLLHNNSFPQASVFIGIVWRTQK